MSRPDTLAETIPQQSSSRHIAQHAVALIPAAMRSVGRTIRTLGHIFVAAWTRRLPADDELIPASWRLALFGWSTVVTIPWLHWCHNYFDPPPNAGVWTGFARLQNYWAVTFVLFLVFILVPMAMGMWVSRRRPRVLWWVAPQMVVVANLIGMVNVLLTVLAFERVGIYWTNDVQFWFRLMPLVGAFAVTAVWMWWVLTPSDVERLAKELAAEQAAREKVEATPLNELGRQQ